jgi:hypothetical protein
MASMWGLSRSGRSDATTPLILNRPSLWEKAMKNLLRTLLPKKSPKAATRADRRARPQLEALEAREMLTVTSHGGAVLPKVEVQALYYGSDWLNNATYYNQTGYLDGFLKNIVNSSYMDMLSADGYGVGRGSFAPGWVRADVIDKTKYLSDGALRNALLTNINAGYLKAPDANRLYVIFVEPNVAVGDSNSNSTIDFKGYHGAFQGQVNLIPGVALNVTYLTDIRYAVIPYHGGSIPLASGTVSNLTHSWLGALDSQTQTTSHEIAEAATDPDVGYKTLGWNDDVLGEVGDVTVGQTVHLNGYAVQRISDKNDQAMTPRGATSVKAVDFVLAKDGNLWMKSGSGLTKVASGVASVSDQGIDNHGHAMVDVVFTNGYADEYHEGSGLTYLAGGAKSARAGQGVSYVLFKDGTLYEYKNTGGPRVYIGSNVTSIDAGTDQYGVNMVAEVWLGSYGYEHSDSTGWHYMGANVKSVSAGPLGSVYLVSPTGNLSWYTEGDGIAVGWGSGIAQMTRGFDEHGNIMIDELTTDGKLYEYRDGTGWLYLDNNVKSIGKAHAGVVDVVFTWGGSYTLDASGFHYLIGNASAVA